MIHNYRWRLGLADGEPQYDDLERRLAEGPAITMATITLEGDANGAPHPDPSAYKVQRPACGSRAKMSSSRASVRRCSVSCSSRRSR